MEQSKKVPVLRFPEFSGEWEEKNLGELSEISSGGTPNRANQHFWNGSIPWVSTALIDFNLIDRAEEYITEEGLKNSSAKLYPVGTLLMAMYGQGKTRGKIAILNIEASTNQACASIVTNKEVLNHLFAFQNLSKRYSEIRDLSNQGGQENLSGGIIKKINISFPSVPEQQKIADFLTQIDNKINQLSQKKQLLERYKKGVMQQIFSQEIRFTDDDGGEFPEWEEKELDSLCIIKKGIQLNRDAMIENAEFPVINGGIKESGYTTEWNTESNTITISEGGNSCGFVNMIKQKFWCGGHCYYIGELKSIDNEYLYQILKFNQDGLMRLRVGSGLPNIQKKSLSEYIIFYSPTIKEQTKIANFLTAIDNKIALVESQLHGTKQYKKGLLQQLFV